MHYNFVHPHHSLGKNVTPEMAAGVSITSGRARRSPRCWARRYARVVSAEPSGLRVRLATAADESDLRRLYQEFHAFHVRGVPDRLSLPAAEPDDGNFGEAIRQIFAAEDAVILVAEVDGTVVGFAEMYVRRDEVSRYTLGRQYAHLQSLAVTEALRGRGIGVLLLREAERWATEHGATEISTDVWEFKEGPLAFYERAGYQTLRRTLIKRKPN